MKTFALTAAVVSLAATTVPAMAESSDPQSQGINLSEINLDSPEGQRLLDQRIDQAARQVCGLNSAVTGTRIKSASSRACYEKAKTSAKKQVAAMIESQRRGG